MAEFDRNHTVLRCRCGAGGVPHMRAGQPAVSSIFPLKIILRWRESLLSNQKPRSFPFTIENKKTGIFNVKFLNNEKSDRSKTNWLNPLTKSNKITRANKFLVKCFRFNRSLRKIMNGTKRKITRSQINFPYVSQFEIYYLQ